MLPRIRRRIIPRERDPFHDGVEVRIGIYYRCLTRYLVMKGCKEGHRKRFAWSPPLIAWGNEILLLFAFQESGSFRYPSGNFRPFWSSSGNHGCVRLFAT